MKHFTYLIITLALSCITIQAQPPEMAPPTDPEMQQPLDASGVIIRRPSQQWLERMKERRPEEFERMEELRRENPAAFRGRLKEKVDEKRVVAVLKDYPPVYQAFTDLEPEQQTELIQQLFSRPQPPPHPYFKHRKGRRSRRPEEDDFSNDLQKFDAESMTLGKNYQRETDPDRKAEIKNELQANLEKIFDLKHQQRQEKVEQMAQRLESLRKKQEERKASRDKIIQRRLDKLAGKDNLDW